MKDYGKIIENIEILDVAAEGKCIAKIDGKVIFVHHTAPGDVVDVKIIGRDKKFLEAVPVHFHSYSKQRVEPHCVHFGVCGGCKWQHIDYHSQLIFKQKQVKDALERIAKVQFPEIQPIIGSSQTTFYRNKLDFTFSNKRWFETKDNDNENKDANALGFHIPGRFDKILDIEKCHHQADPSNAIRNGLKNFCLEHNFDFFDIKNRSGLMRNLIIRTASTGEIMVIVQFFYQDKMAVESVMNYLKSNFKIDALLYIINEKGNETYQDLEILVYAGKDYIMEEMEGLKFKIGPKSFYQTNSAQAYELYKVARQLADIQQSDIVYDLYTGTGTIANFVAKQAKKVVGVEYVPAAIDDAKANSSLNAIANTSFFAGDISKVFTNDFIKRNGTPNVIITDPPRAGMDAPVIQVLLDLAAPKIVYVSCNPATQARDLALLDAKYRVEAVQPVDMFPHTHHVENVVLLKLK